MNRRGFFSAFAPGVIGPLLFQDAPCEETAAPAIAEYSLSNLPKGKNRAVAAVAIALAARKHGIRMSLINPDTSGIEQ